MPDIRDNFPSSSGPSAEIALRRHGMTSTVLVKLAHAAANDGLTRMKPPPPLDTNEREDLVAALLEYGLRWAIEYDINRDAKRNFETSVYSRMRLRVIDWCRTNIHDSRYGTNKRHLSINVDDWTKGGVDPATAHGTSMIDEYEEAPRANKRGHPTLPWSDSTKDAFVEPDFQDVSASRMRIERWEIAARRAGVTLEQWITDTLDAAAELERAA